MADTRLISDGEQRSAKMPGGVPEDTDPIETQEWLDSLQYILDSRGLERAAFLLSALQDRARREGLDLPVESTTPYVNTIPRDQQPAYPGNREIERRIKSIIRWNAMAMVVRANREFDGIGGHISTYASGAGLVRPGRRPGTRVQLAGPGRDLRRRHDGGEPDCQDQDPGRATLTA